MGDPKFSKRKYDTPSHPWQGERIKLENVLLKKYGLKNKKELWKAQSLLRNYRGKGRDLLARLRYGDQQAEIERKGLLSKLANQGILPDDASLDDLLALDVERVLDRRLQTLVYMKGLAYTTKQARQLIVHGHTVINERKVTVPGYLVTRSEETSIAYNPYSPVAHELHPARPTAEHIERVTREFTAPKEAKTEGDFKAVIPKKPKEEKKPPESKPKEEKKSPESKPKEEKKPPESKPKEEKKPPEPKAKEEKAEDKKPKEEPKKGSES
jgi:small subunit ribosomal protein S4